MGAKLCLTSGLLVGPWMGAELKKQDPSQPCRSGMLWSTVGHDDAEAAAKSWGWPLLSSAHHGWVVATPSTSPHFLWSLRRESQVNVSGRKSHTIAARFLAWNIGRKPPSTNHVAHPHTAQYSWMAQYHPLISPSLSIRKVIPASPPPKILVRTGLGMRWPRGQHTPRQPEVCPFLLEPQAGLRSRDCFKRHTTSGFLDRTLCQSLRPQEAGIHSHSTATLERGGEGSLTRFGERNRIDHISVGPQDQET